MRGDIVKMKPRAHAPSYCSLGLPDDFEGAKMSGVSRRESFNYEIYHNPPSAV